MVLPDIFIDQDSPNAMYAKAGLDAKGIVAKAFEALGQNMRGDVVKLADSRSCKSARDRVPASLTVAPAKPDAVARMTVNQP